MSIARMAVTLQAFEAKSPVDEPTRGARIRARVLDWLMQTQKRRAERLIQKHPEWRTVPPTSAQESSMRK